MKTKPIAAWAALLFGSLGLHRFYLYGSNDKLAWLHPWPTLFGLLGARHFQANGADDPLATWGLPILCWMLALGALNAIVIALTPDDKWNARHNGKEGAAPARWAPILAAIAGLLVGGTFLMIGIVFAAQRYFEISLGK